MSKNSRTLLYAGIGVVAIIVVVAAIAGYMYLDEQNRHNQQRESLKNGFDDQLNVTGLLHATIAGAKAPVNKNYVEDFRAWIDGYRGQVANYSAALATLVANGTAYQQMLDDDSSDYANVSAACVQAQGWGRTMNDSIADYETQYKAVVAKKNTSVNDYDQALDHAASFYAAAWTGLQDNASYPRYGGYHAYLLACDQNITNYNNSIGAVISTGAAYQAFLKGDDYYAINATVAGLYANVTTLGQRYAVLRQNIPNVTIELNEMQEAIGEDGKYYKTQSFQVHNYAYPMSIWNVVGHFQLIDNATGAVRSSADVPVTIALYISDYFQAKLFYDVGHEYTVRYWVTFDY